MKKRVRVLLMVLGILAAAGFAWSRVKPTHDRIWVLGHEKMPRAYFSENSDTVVIHDIRNFDYDSLGNFRGFPNYYGDNFNLDSLVSVWFVLAPFEPENRGPAHTFLSFGFADSQYLAISVEARREKNESYSILKGLLKQYEIIYVVGTEYDLIRSRVGRGDEVYLYPIKAPKEKIKLLFIEMLQRANKLYEEPEFYNTLTNNCTTNILYHANFVSSKKIPYGREVLLPGYADELAKKMGLLDTGLSIEDARRKFLVNNRARAAYDDPRYFSVRIRPSE